jgi:hypothetical protein
MANVTLSLFAGAGAQFLDNSGNVLTGGLIYTYAAGTTTPLAAYTSNLGTTAHPNPIILDASGRIATGEIWLNYGYGYKFVLKDANNVLIGTYDNIPSAALPPIFNDASSISYEQGYTVTAGAFVVGSTYLITSVGNTNFVSIGATSNTVGVLFTATGVGSGTGTAKLSRTIQNKLQESVSVKDFGAVGDGTTDDTAAINNAIAYVKSLTNGGSVYFPVGVYAVTEINATNISIGFTQSVKLYGAGRLMTKIVPYSTGNVLLNLLGSNNCTIQDITLSSVTYSSQCAIFLARSNTSANCNNNKFLNVYTVGSYSVASVVSNGSESSNWFNSKFENSNSSSSYRTFWTGGGILINALQGITVVNGGTILNTNNPNTDNKMFGCEFYSPYNNAKPFRFSTTSSYSFFGCAIICGSSNNCRLVEYTDEYTNVFNGPISWYGCHFEVFGTGNVVHFLNPNETDTVFYGISSYGGYYVTSGLSNPSASVLDYDRTNINNKPQLSSSTWTTPTTAPGSTNSNFYTYTLLNSNIALKPNNVDGNIFVLGYLQNSNVDCINYYGGGIKFLTCIYNTTATALPTTGTYTVGTTIQRETPVVGQPIGWKCTVSGTLGTLNSGATTGSGTINTNVLTVNTATGLTEGCCITVAGASGPFYVIKLSGTTAYLHQNLSATVVNAAIGFSNATLVALANL